MIKDATIIYDKERKGLVIFLNYRFSNKRKTSTFNLSINLPLLIYTCLLTTVNIFEAISYIHPIVCTHSIRI